MKKLDTYVVNAINASYIDFEINGLRLLMGKDTYNNARLSHHLRAEISHLQGAGIDTDVNAFLQYQRKIRDLKDGTTVTRYNLHISYFPMEEAVAKYQADQEVAA